MDAPVTFGSLMDAVLDAAEENAAPAEGAGEGKPEAAVPEPEAAQGGTGQDALPGLPAADAEKTPEEQDAYETACILQDSGTAGQLEAISGQLDALSLQLEEMHASQLQAAESQTLYIRDGNMSLNIILGFIAGILFVQHLFQERR